MEQNLSFRPRARIVRTIGDRLISGPIAAVIEAIKNSHDADASYCRVSLIPPLRKGSGSIVIEDDGHGMTLEVVRDKWMEPATSDKVKRKSPAGRNVLGSKGVGRFSAARLGNYLTLETVAIDVSSGKRFLTTIKNIDWDIFDTTEYLDEVHIECSTQETNRPTGTKLIIESLKDEWSEKLIKDLFGNLRAMIAPKFTPNEANEFRIYLDLSRCKKEFPKVWTDGHYASLLEKADDMWRIQSVPLLDACDYRLQGIFDKTGRFFGTWEIKRAGLPPEEIEFGPLKDNNLLTAVASCGEVGVDMYIFDRDKDAVQSMTARAGRSGLSYKQGRELINDLAGLKIYRDSYRIRPYGDRDSDWLGLDKMRVQNPAQIIGHDQMAGYIIVDSEKNSNLIEKSSREGFEENEQYLRLKELLVDLIRVEIGSRRYSFRKKIETQDDPDVQLASFERAKVEANLSWVEEIIQSLPQDKRSQASEVLAKKSTKLIRYLETLQEKTLVLQYRVAIGMIVSEVIHEGKIPIQFIKSETDRLIRKWPKLFDNHQITVEAKQDVVDKIGKIYNKAEVLAGLFSTLQPLSAVRRGDPQSFDPIKLALDIRELFSQRSQELGLEIAIVNKQGVDRIIGYKQDIQPAITNIIDNALYWLENDKTENPRISVAFSVQDRSLVIDISNNGPAIPTEFIDDIFDVGFTLKASGSGLGLAIAKETLSRGGGSVSCDLAARGNVNFKILYPLEVS